MNKSVSSVLSDELDKVTESLRQISMAPKPIPEPPNVVEDPQDGDLAWWILPLGVGIAALVGSGVTLLVMQRSGSRNEPPLPPSTWQQAP